MIDSSVRTFFFQWTRNPAEVGSIVPSSRLLAEAMAGQVDGLQDGIVVEIGAGTGTVSQALLDAGVQPKRLLIVEQNARLAEFLCRRFPGIRVACGDASRLVSIARRESLARVAAVVSGLPFLLIGERKRYAILKQAFDVMGGDGRFVQFTYGLLSPVPRPLMSRLGLKAQRTNHVWFNLPPASIWRFERIRPPSERRQSSPGPDRLTASRNIRAKESGVDGQRGAIPCCPG